MTAPGTIHITAERALMRLREVVGERPEWVDPNYVDGCLYVVDGKPQCVVGCVLVREGVPVDRLADLNDYRVRGLVYGEDEPPVPGLTIDPLALDILDAAQRRQDNGQSWSSALQIAEEVAAEHVAAGQTA